MFCKVGFYAWPANDDFGGQMRVIEQGFWESQIQSYIGWMGRVTSIFLFSFFTLFPFETCYKWFPAIHIFLYVVAMYVFVSSLFRVGMDSKNEQKKCLLFALLLTSYTLAFNTSLNETLYWLSGMQYFEATIFLLLVFSLSLRAMSGSRLSFILCTICLLLSGTMLEQSCMVQGIIISLAVLYSMQQKKHRAILITFWLASFLAALIIYFAPGNAIRIAAVLKNNELSDLSFIPHVLSALKLTTKGSLRTSFIFFIKPLTWCVLLFLPDITFKILKLNIKIWHIIITPILIAIGMHFIPSWAGGGTLPARAEGFTIWTMGSTWAFLWLLVYKNAEIISKIKSLKLFKYRYAVLILCLVFSANFISIIRDWELFPRFYDDNINRVNSILSQKNLDKEETIVSLIGHRPALLFVSDLDLDSSKGLNRAYRKFYALKNRVVAVPETINRKELKQLENGDSTPLINIAERGNALVQRFLGELYDPTLKVDAIEWGRTLDVSKNAEEAEKWYIKSVENGNVQACRRLVRMYIRNGQLKEALPWLFHYSFLWAFWPGNV